MRRFDTPDHQRLALNAWVKLARASSAVGARHARRLAAASLTESQFGVLDALHHLGPQHQCDLARKILRTNGNVTLVIDHLEKRGLVRRVRRDEDRRFIQVELTPAGEALIREVFPQHADAVATDMGVLSAAELRQLIRLCRRLAAQPAPALDD